MTRRAETGKGTPGERTGSAPLATLVGPLVAGMTATRQRLLEWVQTAGLVALEAVFREEAAALAGPKAGTIRGAPIITGAARAGS